MTEEKKASEKILERMDTLETTLRTLIERRPPQNLPSEKESAENAWEHVHVCPTCKPKLDKEKEEYAEERVKKVAAESKDLQQKEKEEYAKEHVKKVAAESKDLQYECVGCGTHFEKGKKECPNCRGTFVRST